MTQSPLTTNPPDRPDDGVNQFISCLTHDLRSPLTAARVSAQLIRKNLLEEAKVLNLLGRIISNIDRADHLIQGLLDFNRIQSGQKLEIVIEPCDLAILMKESLIDLQIMHGDRFLFTTPETLIGYWSSQDAKRILENLASNAVKYGKIDAPISINLQDQGDQIELSVHNEGNPIPLDQQALLYEPFQRLRIADQPNQKGWGLGLAIVREITEAHNGCVQLQSNFETGTTFKVVLPKDCRT